MLGYVLAMFAEWSVCICERERESLACMQQKVAAGYRFGVSAYKVLIQYGVWFLLKMTALNGICVCVYGCVHYLAYLSAFLRVL